MRPGWKYPFEETQSPEPTRESRVLERTILLGALALIALGILLFACRAHSQEAPTMLIPEVLFEVSTNQPVERTLLKRPAQPMVPPLPSVVGRTVTTNVTPDGRWRRVTTTEQEIMPPPLIQDKPKTNAFWVMCPVCEVRAIRTPHSIEDVEVRAVPDGDQIERRLWFRCCRGEFRAKHFKFVETPIAEEVALPVK